jgi:hypothetical protein
MAVTGHEFLHQMQLVAVNRRVSAGPMTRITSTEHLPYAANDDRQLISRKRR